MKWGEGVTVGEMLRLKLPFKVFKSSLSNMLHTILMTILFVRFSLSDSELCPFFKILLYAYHLLFCVCYKLNAIKVVVVSVVVFVN